VSNACSLVIVADANDRWDRYVETGTSVGQGVSTLATYSKRVCQTVQSREETFGHVDIADVSDLPSSFRGDRLFRLGNNTNAISGVSNRFNAFITIDIINIGHR
jgi:hypothetical protein